MSCSRILNSIKGFKLNQLQWSNITLAGAHNDEGPTGACPEGLLPSGDPAVRGEDTSPRRLPKGSLRDELNKLGRPHSGCGPGHEGSTSYTDLAIDPVRSGTDLPMYLWMYQQMYQI